ncbi:MAG TPA: type VI secretion system tip protein TssI/VgrG, partial [Polyangiaceae bacterium]
IVTEVLPDGEHGSARQARTALLVEPRLANLRYAGGYRIFQDQSLKEIAEALALPEGIALDWRTLAPPPKRGYRTQLDESDFDFLARLAADEGFHFFFEHDDTQTTLVFTDEPQGFRDLDAGDLPYEETDGAVAGERVRTIRRAQRVRTGALEHRDYDFENPRLTLLGRSEAPGPQSEANTARRERREYPGRFVDPASEGVRRARAALQELRSDAVTLSGTAMTLRFAAGRCFTLRGHRDGAFNQRLLVTAVEGSGAVQAPTPSAELSTHARFAVERSAFEAVAADTAVRPKRRAKPAGRLQVARVVGPNEGDPFVDKYGRVKVQFPWDRDGEFDEHSSCWIRMSTPLAYDQGGFYSPHRVGSEVLVDFIDGDIDRPVVVGALYNALQRQPSQLPDEAARSTWFERSVPGGEGFNAVTFDNTAGHERIAVHAQHDRQVQVGHDDAETVGCNQTISIGADQTSSVGANRTASIAANDTTRVKGDRTEDVTGAESVTVTKERSHVVRGASDEIHVTDGDRTVTVYKGNHTRNVKLLDKTESDNAEIHARFDVHVTGDRKIEVKQGNAVATMEEEHLVVQVPQHVVIDCPSGVAVFKDKKIVVQAAEELVLQCGEATISLKKDGTISVQGSKEVALAVANSSVKLEPAKAAVAGASVEFSAVGQMKIAGALVKIN